MSAALRADVAFQPRSDSAVERRVEAEKGRDGINKRNVVVCACLTYHNLCSTQATLRRSGMAATMPASAADDGLNQRARLNMVFFFVVLYLYLVDRWYIPRLSVFAVCLGGNCRWGPLLTGLIVSRPSLWVGSTSVSPGLLHL